MKREQIKAIALANGFKLKTQPHGADDLNPYVYEFAQALLEQASAGVDRAADLLAEKQDQLDDERARAIRAELVQYQLKAYQAELVRELTSCQSVLFMLARGGEVTPAYADDAKAVLERKPEQSLAAHDAEVIDRFLAEQAPRLEAVDPELYHCEWAIYQERERLHEAASKLRQQAREAGQ